MSMRFQQARDELVQASAGTDIDPWNGYVHVAKRYNERHRKYHTVGHILDTLRWAENIVDTDFPWVDHLVYQVITSLVWHDAVYVPGSSTNEEDSARCAAASGVKDVDILKAIRKTKTHEEPDNFLEMVVFDADLLAGLNPNCFIYDGNSDLVREEYQLFTDEEFYLGRKKVLRGFLGKSNIFYTRYASQFETRVRKNIEHELAGIAIKGF